MSFYSDDMEFAIKTGADSHFRKINPSGTGGTMKNSKNSKNSEDRIEEMEHFLSGDIEHL